MASSLTMPDGQLRTVNLYQLAAANGFPSTPDPLIANTLSQINQSLAGGTLTSRTTANDYNRNNFNFLASGEHKIDFPQGKLDWVINSKHHWEATGGVNPYRLFPDGINAVIPVFPGSGTVLGSKVNAGQREAFWTGSTALRSRMVRRIGPAKPTLRHVERQRVVLQRRDARPLLAVARLRAQHGRIRHRSIQRQHHFPAQQPGQAAHRRRHMGARQPPGEYGRKFLPDQRMDGELGHAGDPARLLRNPEHRSGARDVQCR